MMPQTRHNIWVCCCRRGETESPWPSPWPNLFFVFVQLHISIVAAVAFVDFLFFAVALPAETDSGFMVFTHTVGVHACRALLRKQIINLLSSLLCFYRDPALPLSRCLSGGPL